MVKINDYKIIDKNDLYPLIIKSIQDLDNKFNNILDDVNNITDKNTLELKNKFDDNLSFSNIINNLSSTYQKLLNDNNNLQKKIISYDSIIRENNLLKNRIQNLEKQVTNLVNRI